MSGLSKTDKAIVTLSWDDGSASDLKNSALMEKYSLRSTFYISRTYEWLEKSLTEEGIREIGRTNEVGAHTVNHPRLGEADRPTMENEIKASKAMLESLTGQRVRMFCYPYGSYNDDVKAVVQEAGFIGARTCRYGNFDGPEDPYEMPITLYLSNGNPRWAVRICLKHRLSPLSYFDWEYRAKELFNLVRKKGGVYHLFSHSAEFQKKQEWDKLERVLKYISGRKDIAYMTNGELVEYYRGARDEASRN